MIGCSRDRSTSAVENVELIVSSAPSLKDSLEEIKNIYCDDKKNIQITFNYGPSGWLQNQIEQGSATDIFISQGENQMDELEMQNLILKETRVNLVSDELVLITGKNNMSINCFEDLLKPEVKKIGIGVPNSVPAAKTAQETLETLAMWDELQTKLVMGKDLFQVMSYVETENAEAGFVWDTIAKTSNKVRIAAIAPENSHNPVFLPAAVISSSKNLSAADEFLNYLQSEEAMNIFEKNGFKRVEVNKED
ncbi:molybdate ABC transporter substrate-binding protein [Clostridium formicaceticum]|nr:molybdate ABC transporter substrate-binding protein [Clostridium formicaceticum]